MEDTVRWCVNCNVEVPKDQPRCPDCWAKPTDPPLPSTPPPDDVDLATIDTGLVSWIRSVSSELRSAGIEHWVEYEGTPPLYLEGSFSQSVSIDLITRLEDVERAKEVREPVLRSSVPDIPVDFTATDQEGGSCPACGYRLPADPVECPDCGLSFGNEDGE